MGATAHVKVELTSEAKLAALNEYNRRTKEAADRTADLRTQMQGLTAMRGKVAGALAGIGLGAGLAAISNQASVLAGEIARSAGRVGTSAEGYQVFGNILKGAGGDAADLTAALAALRNNLGEAIRNPDAGPAKVLKEIGETAAGLSRLKPEQILERVARGLASIEDPARRASLAQDLLGKGATNIAPLLDRLAVDGYAALRAEVERTAGVMSNEMAKALDDVANRTQNASNRMTVALAPFQLKVSETKASLAELFADLASSPLSATAGAAAIGGVALAGAGSAAAKAGGLGSAQAWGMLAAMSWAKASTTMAPAWMSIGALIAVGFAGAAVIKGMEQKALAEKELSADFTNAPIDRARALRESLENVRDPEVANRIRLEAARRSLEMEKRATETKDPLMRSNLEVAAKLYDGIIRAAATHGERLASNNRALDEENAKRSEAESEAADLARREETAADWLLKQGHSLDEQVKARRRNLDLAQMDPAARLAALEEERTNAIATAQVFTGTTSERRINELDTAVKLVAIDQEIVAAKKEITAESEKALEAQIKLVKATGPDMGRRKDVSPEDLARGVDIASSMRLAELQAKGAADQANFGLTDEQKRALRRSNLEDQRGVLDESAGMLRPTDARRAQEFEDRSAGIGADLAADAAGRPTTALDGVKAGLTEVQNQWSTLAQEIQSGIASIGDAISGSLAGGMNQLLGTTDHWTRQLGSIAGPIMGSITQAISNMFAQWITARAAASLKSILFSTKEGAADAAAKAPGAMFTSISSWGTAAALGIAGFLAAKALSGGFFEGGFTGLGNPHDPAGIVHRGEFVVPHDVTSAVGPGALAGLVESVRNPSQMTDGFSALAPQSANMSGAVAGNNGGDDKPWIPEQQVVIIDHRDQELIDRVLSSPRFKAKVLRIGRNNTGDFGSPT